MPPLDKPHKLLVTGCDRQRSRGRLAFAGTAFPCALGRSGITVGKREGDGATPVGVFPVLYGYYRADKIGRPLSRLPLQPIHASFGWCDEPTDRNYNRFVRLPYPASAEKLMREDELYDVCIVLGHNQKPRVRGLGSAIFLHVAKPGFLPTEGCIALAFSDMLKVVKSLRRGDHVIVKP